MKKKKTNHDFMAHDKACSEIYGDIDALGQSLQEKQFSIRILAI